MSGKKSLIKSTTTKAAPKKTTKKKTGSKRPRRVSVPFLRGCSLCNDGIYQNIKAAQEEGLSIRAAAREMADQAAEKFPELAKDFSENVIQNRFKRMNKPAGSKRPKKDAGSKRPKIESLPPQEQVAGPGKSNDKIKPEGAVIELAGKEVKVKCSPMGFYKAIRQHLSKDEQIALFDLLESNQGQMGPVPVAFSK